MVSQIEQTTNRCKSLEEKCDETFNLLKSFIEKKNENFDNTDVEKIRILLQVKIREKKEQQRRFEQNYHTLLCKVKEHMKGRSVAEKQARQLQGAKNRLTEEYSALRLQINSKNLELNSLQTLVESHVKNNDILKSRYEKLEQELYIRSLRENEFKDSISFLEKWQKSSLEDLHSKEAAMNAMKIEIEDLRNQLSGLNSSRMNDIDKINLLSTANNEIMTNINTLETLLEEEKLSHGDLKISMLEKEEEILKLRNECDKLLGEVATVTEKKDYYLNELKHANENILQKTNVIGEYQYQSESLQAQQQNNDTHLQSLIATLKMQLNDLEIIKREKFFLQRLCHDLKIALEIHVSHNKLLKNYLNSACKEKEIFSSLPFSLHSFPAPTTFDDDYINKLLEDNKALFQDKPLNDIQESLFAIRSEISVLQQEILDKNKS